jgi:ubiquinone/menaquinone biosynthesis C-methylase UbiE
MKILEVIMETDEIVRNYYNSTTQDEWERLERHPFEFLITTHYLDRYIKPGDTVLDIGGGPGRYSMYLAGKGCSVTLFDLAEENVAFARRKAAELRLNINAVRGDAREADRLVSTQFDHVLLMGPMYHLLEEADCAAAITAALKLLNSGGVIFVSFISLNAGFIYFLKDAPLGVFDESEQEYIYCYLNNTTFCGDAFTKVCMVAPRDILPLMGRFKLQKLHLFSQESITTLGDRNILALNNRRLLDRWTELACAVCERDEYLSYAEHLMYIGRKIY